MVAAYGKGGKQNMARLNAVKCHHQSRMSDSLQNSKGRYSMKMQAVIFFIGGFSYSALVFTDICSSGKF